MGTGEKMKIIMILFILAPFTVQAYAKHECYQHLMHTKVIVKLTTETNEAGFLKDKKGFKVINYICSVYSDHKCIYVDLDNDMITGRIKSFYKKVKCPKEK